MTFKLLLEKFEKWKIRMDVVAGGEDHTLVGTGIFKEMDICQIPHWSL